MVTHRHKVFISFHQDDREEVENFINDFHLNEKAIIPRALGLEMNPNLIRSSDTSYVMKRIRELYLLDSTVTLVLIGKCTWSRRYVDWEIQSSLRQGRNITPNGVLGILLPSYRNEDIPYRLGINLPSEEENEPGYARIIDYPRTSSKLQNWIHDSYNARRSRAKYITNPRDRSIYSRSC